MENLAPKQFNEPTPKDEIEKTASHIIEQFQEQFPEHSLMYKGFQSGFGFEDDAYLFNIMTEQSNAYDATFSVTELDLQSVEDAFVKKMKLFGEDIKEIA